MGDNQIGSQEIWIESDASDNRSTTSIATKRFQVTSAKMADIEISSSGKPPETLIAEHFPRSVLALVLIKISADNSPLNQLPVKKYLFWLIIKTFFHQHQCIVKEKAIDLSVSIKEICTLLVKLLFMARLEEKLLADSEYTLPLYLRYIDDIFLIFPYSEQDLTKFMTYMNNAHPTIKFTEEHSRSDIVFLDTTVKRLNENLYTDLYTKPTDTHSYLHFTSSHPKHTRHNGPYGQFLRLRRNCHFDDDFNRHADAMTQHYLKRGYPQDLITQSRHKAFAVLHHDLIHKPVTKRATMNRLPLVLTLILTS